MLLQNRLAKDTSNTLESKRFKTSVLLPEKMLSSNLVVRALGDVQYDVSNNFKL